MMVGNDIRHDTRVLKTALALADGGVDVTILGYASSGAREESHLGPVRIVRVPVAWRLRDRMWARQRAARERRLFHGALDQRGRRLAALEAGLRAREAEQLGGRGRRARAVVGRASAKVAAVRQRYGSGIARRETAWRSDFETWLAGQDTGASWRRIIPEIDDYELAFGPAIDELDWDVIHAHDVHLVGVATRAVARRRARGGPGDADARWVYDAHEFVAGLSVYPPRTKRKVAAYLDLEQEYVRGASGVVTVTEPLAVELQRRYRLPDTPTVVMNSPVLGDATRDIEVGIREACGLAPDVPLMVYSGGVTVARGIDTAVEALPQLDGVHLAVVCVPHHKVTPATLLAEKAAQLGVADRLHLLDPVPPDQVSSFVASADVGIIPLRHFGSHEVALANKLFEYTYAGLPVLVSDCKAQAEFVSRHGLGGVHTADDPDSFAAALRDVLDRASQIRRTIADSPGLLEPYSWPHQEKNLRDFYRRLLRDPDGIVEPAASSTLDGLTEQPVERTDRPSVVGIGPANMAGQAWAWAKAVEANVPGVRTQVMVVDRDLPLLFPADEVVPVATYRRDPAWGQAFESRALAEWTHALLEAGRPLFGVRHGGDFSGDAEVMRRVGIRVGLLLHGSEARNPARHATTTPWSPFTDPDEELTARLQRQFDALAPKFVEFAASGAGPVFVSTPDLLDDVEGSIWLPVCVDAAVWRSDREVGTGERPVVLHAPSRASLKGSARADETAQALADAGVIDYRRVEGVPPEEMPALVADADIVLDQFALGSYGVMAVQGMAAGRAVIGHVTERVRGVADAAARAEGAGPLPIVEASPDTLADELRRLAADRDALRAAAHAGREFAGAVHDGRLSARVLAEHLRLRGD